MGSLGRGKRPLIYILVICLLTLGYVFFALYNPEKNQETLGSVVSQPEQVDTFQEIDLDGLNKDLFFSDDFEIVGNEICMQFPKHYVMGQLQRNVTQTQDILNGNTVGCIYHLEGTDMSVSILLKNGSSDNEKRGHELIGREVTSEEEIDGDNYVVRNAKKEIIEIYLIITDTKYVQISMNSEEFSLGKKLIELSDDISKELSIYHLN